MKNSNEIRMAAQAIYRNIVTMSVNEMNGCKEENLDNLLDQFDKAVDWSIDNGEFYALKSVCRQMFSIQAGVSADFRQVSTELFEQFFESPYILGKESRGEIK